jgi:hypothetical protein
MAKKKRGYSILDDPFINLSAVASVTDTTGAMPTPESGNQTAALAALYGAKLPRRDQRKDEGSFALWRELLFCSCKRVTLTSLKNTYHNEKKLAISGFL